MLITALDDGWRHDYEGIGISHVVIKDEDVSESKIALKYQKLLFLFHRGSSRLQVRTCGVYIRSAKNLVRAAIQYARPTFEPDIYNSHRGRRLVCHHFSTHFEFKPYPLSKHLVFVLVKSPRRIITLLTSSPHLTPQLQRVASWRFFTSKTQSFLPRNKLACFLHSNNKAMGLATRRPSLRKFQIARNQH